jgi:hypothetical protein
MAGWLGRAAPFLAVAAVSAFLLTPVCGVLHQCGCRMPWSGGEAHCNARVAGVEHCPWCEHRALGGLAAALILGGQLVAYRLARRRTAPLPAAALALAALVPLSVAAGAIVWLATDYPHFLARDARARLGLPAGPIRCTGGPTHVH